MNRRQFTKRGALGLVVAGLSGSAWKCGSDKISIYVSTISSFLNELAQFVPAQAAFIAQIVKVASDFDVAYRRGDFTNASTFFNTLAGNISTLTTSLGIGTSPRIKTLLSVVNITVRTVAVLLMNEGATKVAEVAKARASNPAMDDAVRTIERLANPKAVDAIFEASRP